MVAQEPRGRCDGLMVSALNSRASGLGSSPGWGHCVLFLGKTRHVPLTTQVYKWVPANLMLGDNPAMDKHPIQGGVEILLVTSCYRNWDKLWPDGPQLALCRLYLFTGAQEVLSLQACILESPKFSRRAVIDGSLAKFLSGSSYCFDMLKLACCLAAFLMADRNAGKSEEKLTQVYVVFNLRMVSLYA